MHYNVVPQNNIEGVAYYSQIQLSITNLHNGWIFIKGCLEGDIQSEFHERTRKVHVSQRQDPFFWLGNFNLE